MLRKKINKGFSLIELLMTVAIIGILLAVAVPAYQTYLNKAKTVDLINASRVGQLMVEEYIQSTGAMDCTNMPYNGQVGFISIGISYSSPNVNSAYINATNQVGALISCSIVVTGTPAAFGGRRVALLESEQYSSIPEVQLASNNLYVQLVVAPGGSGLGRGSLVPWIYSIPVINPDGSIIWTMYSNGSRFAPASLPSIWDLSSAN